MYMYIDIDIESTPMSDSPLPRKESPGPHASQIQMA